MTRDVKEAAEDGMVPEGLPLAKLQSIDLALLQEGNNDEIRHLLEACRESGIFYLNLQGIREKMSVITDGLYNLTRDLYHMPYEEKMLYDVDRLCKMKSNGYVTGLPLLLVSLTMYRFQLQAGGQELRGTRWPA